MLDILINGAGSPEHVVLVVSVLLGLGVLTSTVSDRFGIPALLLFLGVGMLAGSEGPGGIAFDDAALAQFLGTVALIFILFSGALSTDWGSVRPVLREGVLLASIGVLLTACVTGLGVRWMLDLPWAESMLVGAIVSSTDAAAVFSILRAKNVSLKGRLAPLLEFESGSNDPMAVFLTMGLIIYMTKPGVSGWDFLVFLALQVGVGLFFGLAMGRVMVLTLRRLKVGYDALYPVMSLALAMLTYGLAASLGGSGFLAVYAAGLIMGNSDVPHKREYLHFHDVLAWLMQIAMFLALGLLVFPSRLLPVAGVGLMLALWLMFVARPISVFVGMPPRTLGWREKAMLSWVGLRGAVPIVLATYPRLAGVQQSEELFNIIFFVVLASVLVQGPLIPRMARWLKVDAPAPRKPRFPAAHALDLDRGRGPREIHVPAGAPAVGRRIAELGLPRQFLVVMIARGDRLSVASGQTVLEADDTILAVCEEPAFRQAAPLFEPAGAPQAGERNETT